MPRKCLRAIRSVLIEAQFPIQARGSANSILIDAGGFCSRKYGLWDRLFAG